jgi:secretion/DNA translocation related TadE-like protein
MSTLPAGNRSKQGLNGGACTVTSTGKRLEQGLDDGSATILAVAMLAVVMMLFAAAVTLAQASILRHRAQTSADLAALSAAQWILDGNDPSFSCDVATEVTARNNTAIASCLRQGEIVSVSVMVQGPSVIAGRLTATAQARAGP